MTTIRSSRDVRPDDRIIAIMGPTGSGKSNLIDTLTQTTRWSGDRLKSVTKNVSAIRIKSMLPRAGEIVLVDTPGFDDTTKSDFEILRMIADWLNETYKRKVKLTGILYLHRITDNRMSGSPHRNLRMLGQLCGSEPAKRLIFVTTMWDKMATKRGEDREVDLRNVYFKPMITLGATTERFKNTSKSAWEIIGRLLELHDEQRVTLIQEEMVDIQRELAETKAAAEVMSDMQKLLTAHKQTIEALRREAERTDNREMVTLLNEQRADIQRQLEETFKVAQKLKIPFTRRFKRFFSPKPKQQGVELGGN